MVNSGIFSNFAAVKNVLGIMVKQCSILFGCLALGELVVWLTGAKLPSSIIGMIILAILLQAKVVQVDSLKGISDFLVSNFGFFFVPPGVALMLYIDTIVEEFIPIVVSVVVSTALVLIVTGQVHQIIRRHGILRK